MRLCRARPQHLLARHRPCGGSAAAASAPLRTLLDTLSPQHPDSPQPGHLRGHIDPTWMQGRTTYGGCSTALCLSAAHDVLAAQQPLRSCHVSFIGPAGGDVTCEAEVVRTGRAMSFVRGDVRGADGKLATTATFAFGASRESNHDVTLSPPAYASHEGGIPSFVLPVDESEDFFGPLDADARPRFTLNFEARLAHGNRPGSGASSEKDPHAYDHWVYSRHKGGRDDGGVDGVDAVVSLLALADMPPPAMLAAATSFVPVSSVQWSVHFLETEDEGGLASMPGGWWLLRSRGEHLREGYVC